MEARARCLCAKEGNVEDCVAGSFTNARPRGLRSISLCGTCFAF
jgi:hypothetical protein